MTGPEHYRRAEELITEADRIIAQRTRPPEGKPDLRGLNREEALRAAAEAMEGPWRDLYLKDPERPQRNIAEAHVHATLALAAATAVRTEADQEAWIAVAGTTPPPGGGGPTPPRGGGPTPRRGGDVNPARPGSSVT
jgi:hypothetical protein